MRRWWGLVLVLALLVPASAAAAQGPVGEITNYAGSDAPDGWLLCDGSTIDSAEYPELCAVIDGIYGSGCVLPDLRGRNIIGAGAGAGLTAREIGDSGGEEAHTLTIPEMPRHTHDVYYRALGHSLAGTPYSQMGFSTDNSGSWPNTMLPSGSGQPHNNMPPYLTLNYIIRASNQITINVQTSYTVPTPVATLSYTTTNYADAIRAVATEQAARWLPSAREWWLFFGLAAWLSVMEVLKFVRLLWR